MLGYGWVQPTYQEVFADLPLLAHMRRNGRLKILIAAFNIGFFVMRSCNILMHTRGAIQTAVQISASLHRSDSSFKSLFSQIRLVSLANSTLGPGNLLICGRTRLLKNRL